MLRLALAWLAVLSGCRGTPPGNPLQQEELTRLVDSLRPAVERATGLAFRSPTPSALRDRAELRAFLLTKLDEDFPVEREEGIAAVYRLLGLLPDTLQLRALLLDLYTEQVAGFYDPVTRTLYGLRGADPAQLRLVLAHELVHALQDQHFNLRRFENWPKGDSDAQLAAHALIEGDATLAMLQYVTKNPLRALGFLKSMGGAGLNSEQLNKAPRSLRETLLFPYQEGMAWARVVHQNGGWGDVSKAFSNLPQSTEQILHPEKYFVQEAPVKVTLPDLRRALGRGWRRIESDVNGEWSTYLILDEFLKSLADSKRAAAGWGGDRYEVYENQRGLVVYVSVSAWDSEKDAREFFEAYVKRSRLRYANARPVADLPTSWSARTPEGMVIVEMRGKRVVVIEGLPQSTSRAVLRSLRASLN